MKRIPTIQFRLEKGDILHINGYPFVYMGDEVVAGSTDPYPITLAKGEVTADYIKAGTIPCKKAEGIEPKAPTAEPTTKLESPVDFEAFLKEYAETLKSLPKENEVDPRFAGKWHNPKGGLILDPFDNPVYGPGCYS